MNLYPDTTFFVALRFFNDTHHETATEFFEWLGGAGMKIFNLQTPSFRETPCPRL